MTRPRAHLTSANNIQRGGWHHGRFLLLRKEHLHCEYDVPTIWSAWWESRCTHNCGSINIYVHWSLLTTTTATMTEDADCVAVRTSLLIFNEKKKSTHTHTGNTRKRLQYAAPPLGLGDGWEVVVWGVWEWVHRYHRASKDVDFIQDFRFAIFDVRFRVHRPTTIAAARRRRRCWSTFRYACER